MIDPAPPTISALEASRGVAASSEIQHKIERYIFIFLRYVHIMFKYIPRQNNSILRNKGRKFITNLTFLSRALIQIFPLKRER